MRCIVFALLLFADPLETEALPRLDGLRNADAARWDEYEAVLDRSSFGALGEGEPPGVELLVEGITETLGPFDPEGD